MRALLLLLSAFWLAACSTSPYPGYKRVADDAYLRYIMLGEGERAPADGDSVLMRFRAARLGDDPGSLWSTERWYLAADLRAGALLPIMRRLREGDSMSVIAPARLWPWAALLRGDLPAPHDTTIVAAELSLRAILTPQQMAERREQRRQADPDGYERRLIAAYVAIDTAGWMRWGSSDLHYRIAGAPRDTARWARGAALLVEWEGFRLEDGRPIDATARHGGPFQWSYGTPDQLLRGLEVAVSLLREGQEGEFLLPSALAFGDRGLPGALEPRAPVRYRVKVRPAPQP